MILRTHLHSGGTSSANARGGTSWGPETIYPFAYANSSFFKSRTAGSSPGVSSEELLVLERTGNVREELVPHLSWGPLLGGTPAPVPKIPQKDCLPWATVVPLLKRKTSGQDIIKALLCVSRKRASEEALPTPIPDSA